MAQILKQHGIILAKKEYDFDLMIFFLTANGILEIKAKSVLKAKAKLRGIIELFDLSKLEFIKGKRNYILVGGKLIRRPLYLRKSLEKSLFLMAMSEISLAIVKDNETQKVFRFWLFILEYLKQIKDNKLLQFFAFCLAHALFLEGLLDSQTGKTLHLESNFLIDLTNLPFISLLKKNYPNNKYLEFIKATTNWLEREGIKFLTFKLFLEKIIK